MRPRTPSKQHLDGSVRSRALAPPVRKAAAVALIYTQSDGVLLALEAVPSPAFVLLKDRHPELNSVQRRTILFPHLLPLKDQDRSISTISVLFSRGRGAHFSEKWGPDVLSFFLASGDLSAYQR